MPEYEQLRILLEGRPVRTAAQLSAALGCTFERAEVLLTALHRMGLAEPVGGGYRLTEAAEARFPVLSRSEVKRRQVRQREKAPRRGECIWCGRVFGLSAKEKEFCSRGCREAFELMRDAA